MNDTVIRFRVTVAKNDGENADESAGNYAANDGTAIVLVLDHVQQLLAGRPTTGRGAASITTAASSSDSNSYRSAPRSLGVSCTSYCAAYLSVVKRIGEQKCYYSSGCVHALFSIANSFGENSYR